MQGERVVSPRDVAELVGHPVVMIGIDDLLLLPRAPRVGAGRPEQRTVTLGEAEQPGARLALRGERSLKRVAAAGADLDLRRDQLTRHRPHEEVVVAGGSLQLLKARDERSRLPVDDRELLLDRDREIRRGVERLPDEIDVQQIGSGRHRGGVRSSRRVMRRAPPADSCGPRARP
jgi:hypothetical protein